MTIEFRDSVVFRTKELIYIQYMYVEVEKRKRRDKRRTSCTLWCHTLLASRRLQCYGLLASLFSHACQASTRACSLVYMCVCVFHSIRDSYNVSLRLTLPTATIYVRHAASSFHSCLSLSLSYSVSTHSLYLPFWRCHLSHSLTFNCAFTWSQARLRAAVKLR